MAPQPQATEAEVGVQLRAFLQGDGFSCVGAKMAVERDTLIHRHYGALGSPESAAHLYGDVRDFAERREQIDLHFATFVATFDNSRDLDEGGFEQMLWRQLQQLHDLDGDEPSWHPDFDPDPLSNRFGFCIGGHPFFIVGLHGEASRLSRRFAYPSTLAVTRR
jgi:FPC/CPF motif-containing protein YcgG